jgi:hypothetical protein
MTEHPGSAKNRRNEAPTGGEILQSLSQDDRETVERHLNFARSLHIETRILQAEHAAPALVDFAHRDELAEALRQIARVDKDLVRWGHAPILPPSFWQLPMYGGLTVAGDDPILRVT